MWWMILTLLPGFALAGEGERISMSRYFAFKHCTHKGECVGPAVKNLESANVQIPLGPYQNGKFRGHDGWDRQSVTEAGITFKSEIHVIQYAKPAKYNYFVYLMLRSGKRQGKVRKLHLQDLAELKEVVITDDPIHTKRGTIQAELVVGPRLPLDHEK